ncbi:MAG TPA: ABC transporter ATP-binding protein [Candidatus Lokiarchaeia archaeon]|nr:ABC transporter ATP-binding protein [Candidatus Lokiarchaeia archaeon]
MEEPKIEEEIVEESVFSPNIFDDALDWIKNRQSYMIGVEITGTWDKDKRFLRCEGTLLKQWTGDMFENEIYLMLTSGEIGEDDILVGRRIIRLPNPRDKKAGLKELTFQNLVLRNSFVRDNRDRLFFRVGEYDKLINWLETFVQKYTITCLIEGVYVSESKTMRCSVSGTIKKVAEKEIYVEIEDAFNPEDPLNEDNKLLLTREWIMQIALRGTNKLHPAYLVFEIGEELRLTDKILDIKGLSVTLGGKNIIHDVNFSVNGGEILGIIGESGAGKTTTLKAILGEFDYTGSIRVFGFDARETKTVAPFIGYIPQELSRMYGNFNALENIVSFGRQYGIPEEILIQRGKKILEDLGIAEQANQPVETLSGGQKRRVSIAISMVHNPKLIFLDEPTSGLDPLARYELWEYLDLINKEYGITLVVISHYLDEIEYCDKAAIFLGGVGFYAFGTPKELKAQLPGGGVALEVTLESVSLKAIEILRNLEGVEFVIQRGERVRILSDLPTLEISDRVLEALGESNTPYHSIELKVDIDMIDYFTYSAALLHGEVQPKKETPSE